MKLRDFFYFNRSDRSVLLFFLTLGLVAIALIFVVGGQQTTTEAGPADSLSPYSPRRSEYANPRSPYSGHAITYGDAGDEGRVERFVFDPNTADSSQLLRLGLRPWQVRNIYKYRAKGGIYRKPSDFARLYGLTQKQYRELEPYIRIGDDYAPAASLFSEEATSQQAAPDSLHHYPVKLRPTERIDLNLADTSQLQRVPGIGGYFARQVDRYRQRLGGFYSVQQLKEIEDFPESALTYFIIEGEIRKLKVNQMTLNELRKHPYINYYQARAILTHRRLRGPLSSLDDLRLLKEFTPHDLERLRPYVEF